MKKFSLIALIALFHFGLSILIVPMTMSVATAIGAAQPEPTTAIQILVVATRVLHYPIISLSLYSRQWFPGDWIYIPILINSILWAVGIYFLFFLWTIIKKKN